MCLQHEYRSMRTDPQENFWKKLDKTQHCGKTSHVMQARRKAPVKICFFICRNCDIHTNIKAADPAQLHRWTVSDSANTVHERVSVLSEQAGTGVAGNQFGQAQQRATDSPPSIIHAPTAGCSSVFSKHTPSHRCGAQMHPPQISNSDIRLEEIINDRLSDEFLCSESQTGQRLRLSQEEVQQHEEQLQIHECGNRLKCIIYVSSGANTGKKNK